jgi:hypothetical protein
VGKSALSMWVKSLLLMVMPANEPGANVSTFEQRVAKA